MSEIFTPEYHLYQHQHPYHRHLLILSLLLPEQEEERRRRGKNESLNVISAQWREKKRKELVGVIWRSFVLAKSYFKRC